MQAVHLRMSILKILNINDVNGVGLVSLLLTVNIFQTFFLLLTLNKQTFAWLILIRQIFLKTRSGISYVMYYFKCEKNLLTISIWTYTITTIWVYQWEIFAKEFTLTLIFAKNMQLTFKWAVVCTFAFLQILLATRLIRELVLSCCKLFQVVKSKFILGS